MIKKKWIIAGIAVTAAAAFFFWNNRSEPFTGYWTMENQPFIQTITASGKILAERKVDLQAEISGALKDISVQPGDRVAAGQILVSIDNSDVAQSVKEREAALSAARARYRTVSEVSLPGAEASVQQLEIGLSDLNKQLEDTRVLFESGAVARAELENLERSVELQTSKLNAARATAKAYASGGASLSEAAAGIAQARESLQTLQSQKEKYILTAPFDGIVLERSREAGEYITAGSTLLTLVDESSYIAEIELEERKIGLIQVGQKVMLWPESFPSKAVEASVSKILPRVESTTGTVKVQIKLMPGEMTWIENLSIQAEIVVRTLDAAMILPAEALWKPSESMVLVESGGTVEARAVKLEAVGLSEYLVLEGLEIGDIVIDPASELEPGDSITLGDQTESGEAS
ncbi:efflux RND transporter periplasmic adaptor subunit [Acidaminobacter hydrogenoformans]|uniref:Barrel-sandwich domain of CusB or HlyD membrane-fusion n=1 Tax=Acidaminobacter hydrogenoformans DSM 2784 TaxID=1120920 RepID=A0A1G5S627_9FIRM|nr:efflux RND transporter periplasmic adaptor subunit [Acidaminobacter hydrogenoformans]SCZ81862.1 Barrel-sandwich domain of CusB or HlyD membrane-fusion [Acidaminobacter hydrogenoformans DSM 2784]